MKKTIAVFLVLCFALTFTPTTLAAGVDDGNILVAEKNGAKYFGKLTNAEFVKYLAADGSGADFYDLNGDRDMNVCDLVALHKNETDINEDLRFDGADSFLIRAPIVNGDL